MPLEVARASYYMMPLYSFVRNQSYHLYPYNRHVWASAPNLLSEQHITVETLMYFALYIRNCAPLTPTLETLIVDKIHESLTNLVQRRNDNTPPTDADVLYAAFALREDVPVSDQINWLKMNESMVEIPTTEFNSHIRSLLYGFDPGARTELKV